MLIGEQTCIDFLLVSFTCFPSQYPSPSILSGHVRASQIEAKMIMLCSLFGARSLPLETTEKQNALRHG
jgi:hypothetical protein